MASDRTNVTFLGSSHETMDARPAHVRLREVMDELDKAKAKYAMGVVSRLKDTADMCRYAETLTALSPGVREECRKLTETLDAALARLEALEARGA